MKIHTPDKLLTGERKISQNDKGIFSFQSPARLVWLGLHAKFILVCPLASKTTRSKSVQFCF